MAKNPPTKTKEEVSPYNSGVEIDQPADNQTYIMPDDTICVSGTAAVGTEAVWILVLKATETPNLATQTKVVVDTTTQLGFAVNAAYGGNDGNPPESGDYKVVVYPVIANTPDTPETVSFHRVPESQIVSVSAQMCLWYALAGSNAQAPYPEEDPVKNFKPLKVVVPLNAAEASFSATGTWRHFASDPATDAGPDGRTDVTVGLENTDYQNANFGSADIAVLTTNVCKLIGLWNDGGTYTLFGIGSELSDQTVPDNARTEGALYLGMHDGKRWFNNSGSLSVTIEWTADECYESLLAKTRKLK